MGPNLIFKLAGAICIIAGAAIFGRTYAGTYRERVEYLTDFNKRLEILKNEIGFMKGILADTVARAGEFEGKAKELFLEVLDNLEDMDASAAWDTACEKKLPRAILNNDDTETIKSLGRLLGASDVDGQISNIEVISSQIGSLMESAEAERKKNEPLFKSIGPIIGVGIAIFLI